jgi:diguanylate cyclase (GGDEF)-like protein
MAEADENREGAVRKKSAEQREQKRRIYWTGLVAASYAIDTLFLGLFAAAGTVARSVPLLYALGAVLVVLAQYAAYRSGWNLGRRDPNLTAPLVAIGTAMQLAIVAAAPQVAFPYLANVFTVFAFGMVWLRLRDSLAVWSLGAVATGAVCYFAGERFAVPVSTPLERGLVWLYFSVVLGRSLYLSVHASDMRASLADSRARLVASLEQIKQLVDYDELTRAHSRRSLVSRLEQERSRSERTGRPFSIAIFDLDHFKRVNDGHGHDAGDEVLKAFVKTVHARMRDTDFFGRYGGEEFLMIFTDTPPALALSAVERIRKAVQAFDWSAVAPDLKLTVSAGVAGWSPGEAVGQVLNRADNALYEAKGAGRNRAHVM